jgi:hypothetical protein
MLLMDKKNIYLKECILKIEAFKRCLYNYKGEN